MHQGTRPVVDGIVRIPRRVGHRRSTAVVRQAPRQSGGLAVGTGYRLELQLSTDEERFVVVAPSGARLYWFADLASAEAEVQSLRAAGPAGGR